ncbi:MAG TPA: superoxide dismutase [Caulobacteraceae bacterium]|jgi:Fe-Mn family superoxide dismutase|nr:superoxide dismutase [Caulobacteraceae bacterium]
MFGLPDLPYAYDALQPVISDRTMHFHHDKHHATYVKTMNDLLEASGDKPTNLEDVVREAARADNRKLFNNSAQAWNHAFFWEAMAPAGTKPDSGLTAAIQKSFEGEAGLKNALVTEGVGHFGSGWVWLTAERGGGLKVVSTHDGQNLLTQSDLTPLLVCDLWEHAYYLDHQNNRKGFLEAWFDSLPNWEFANHQYAAAQGDGHAWRYPEASA